MKTHTHRVSRPFLDLAIRCYGIPDSVSASSSQVEYVWRDTPIRENDRTRVRDQRVCDFGVQDTLLLIIEGGL